ncbi:MAG: hypothetical protein HYW52_02395 [Gemmatimonadetes bacterium]|nr:hypothetical protein [Gemmatimonadota bacterium]MBI2614530.1 hypothetical protein [Gemmatimonadota bacterium]
MIYETETALPGPEVLRRAKVFFTERVPHHAAFLEQEGPTFATFRGQGGEELAIAVLGAEHSTRVRASSLFFDQVIGRFFSTLPAPDPGSLSPSPPAGETESASRDRG